MTGAPTEIFDISVVIPAHDRESTIGRTLTTVTAQDGVCFEIIVVDDGSTDATAQCAEDLALVDQRVQVIRQHNAGVSAARNAGARVARGRFLTFLDCDDEVEPGWLSSYVAELNLGADLVFAPGRAVRPGYPDTPWPILALGPVFGDVHGLFNPGMFALRRDDFEAIGGYAAELRFSENTELGIRITEHLARSGPIVTKQIDRPLVVIHMDPDGRSNADTPTSRYASSMYLVTHHGERLALDPKLQSSYWAIAGIAAARLGNGRDARRCFARAMKAEPTNVKQTSRFLTACLPAARRRKWPVATGT